MILDIDRHHSFDESVNTLPQLDDEAHYQYVQEMMMIYPSELTRYDSTLAILTPTLQMAIRKRAWKVVESCVLFGLKILERAGGDIPITWASTCLDAKVEDHVVGSVFKKDIFLAMGMYVQGYPKYNTKYMPSFMQDYHRLVHNILTQKKGRDDYLELTPREEEMWTHYQIMGDTFFLNSFYHERPSEEISLCL